MADKAHEIQSGDAIIDGFAQAMKEELRRHVERAPRNEWNGPVAVPIEQRRTIYTQARDGSPEAIGLSVAALWYREAKDGR